MQIQFHPASGHGAVRTFSVERRGQRVGITAALLLLLAASSLWFTVPVVLARRLREAETPGFLRQIAVSAAQGSRAAELARSLRQRALDLGDLFNRIAFLYAIPASRWPRALNPSYQDLAAAPPERIAAALALYLRALERARTLVAGRETEDPDLAQRVPGVAPITGTQFEPSAYFGPRRSPWTGEEEFFLGVDLAAPEGSTVIAPGAGTVVFAGAVRRAVTGWFWRLGNAVVISHGASGVTIFGHLGRVDVRRGQRVARGQPLGSVGATGWAISPQLHYEYWRPEGQRLSPTDPLFATLDRRLGRGPLSLEQMEATSAPGPFDAIPGIDVSAEQAGAPQRPAAAPPRHSRHRRI